jgi:hypothetical protein
VKEEEMAHVLPRKNGKRRRKREWGWSARQRKEEGGNVGFSLCRQREKEKRGLMVTRRRQIEERESKRCEGMGGKEREQVVGPGIKWEREEE